ncbi:hypothetical protein TPHA_0F03540 [Tetrapisispora phaffii CBS 4417]|uniref:LicD/FKTN/FKRP nucleotidyltransferase domain-containing protein n=1 Tax=Tetrapisispora phaffii (strain ATCC 24235 / CBS 4417 / NBRC 1672 / NRRL Y-8282 / UCD 70-5) TaxID=1071381 RepID=G8BUP8_TETPH|nr:hypothetical protein TPHA_0F03540 [Tetrapisispora phaffii CBS 4417]CCE63834.1 hypothetical protein TPHA_0F03540 [Tetrapisispora phaffii CBS 4417]
MNLVEYYIKRFIRNIIKSKLIVQVLVTVVLINVLVITMKSTNKTAQDLDKNFASIIKYKPASDNGVYTKPTANSISDILYDPISFLKDLYGTLRPLTNDELGKILYRKLRFDTSYEWLDIYELQKDLLTIQVGPSKNTKVESINDLTFYESDPRLVWSVYIDHLLNKESINAETKIPFSWYDWADFHEYNKIRSLEKTTIRCPFFFDAAFELEKLAEIEKEIDSPLFHKDRMKYNDMKWYSKQRRMSETHVFSVMDKHCEASQNNLDSKSKDPKGHSKQFEPQIKITQLYDKVRPEVYQLQARNYLLTNLTHPLSLTVLDGYKKSFRFYLDQRDNAKNIIESEMLHDFFERNVDYEKNPIEKTENYDVRNNQTKYDYVFDHFTMYDRFVKSDVANKLTVDVKGGEKTVFDKDLFELKEEDFDFDVLGKIKELKAKDKLDLHDQKYLDSLIYSINTAPALATKYFTEASNVKSFNSMGWHRDKRFFNGDFRDDEQEYQQTLNAMIRTFQKFTRSNGIISWLSHGTAYGYMYNGMAFPWDNDFDLQLPIKHLHLLAQYFNQSLIIEDPREGNGRYLLDIGSSITTRTNGNGKNNIDARFIDINSGLYIDLTGISVTASPLKGYMDNYFKKNIGDKLEKVLSNQTISLLQRPESGLASMNIFELENYTKNENTGLTKDQISTIQDMAKHERELVTKGKGIDSKYSETQRYTLHKLLGIFNCKNNHFSTLQHLSPLRLTDFHGVATLVPNGYLKLLKYEYSIPENYIYTTYKEMAYVPELRAWLRSDILKKAGSMFSWYPDFPTLSSPLTNLTLPDLQLMYYNIVKGGYTELVGVLYNSFNMTSYRVKELEIQSSDLKVDEKRDLLTKLYENVSPNIQNPCKDPYLFSHERRLWSQLSQELSNSTLQEIRQDIASSVLKDLWSWSIDLYKRDYKFFEYFDVPYNMTVNLNEYGINLFSNATGNKASQIFKKDKPF